MMSIFDRIMLFFSAIMMAVASAVAFLISRNGSMFTSFFARVHDLVWGSWASTLFLGLIVLVLIFFLLSLAARSESKGQRSARSIVKTTAMGEVRVSLNAIEDLVSKVAKNEKCIRDAKSSVYGDSENMSIDLKIEVAAGVNIPDLCSRLEGNLIATVDQMMGLVPKHIHFDIANVTGDVAVVKESKTDNVEVEKMDNNEALL